MEREQPGARELESWGGTARSKMVLGASSGVALKPGSSPTWSPPAYQYLIFENALTVNITCSELIVLISHIESLVGISKNMPWRWTSRQALWLALGKQGKEHEWGQLSGRWGLQVLWVQTREGLRGMPDPVGVKIRSGTYFALDSLGGHSLSIESPCLGLSCSVCV